MECSVSVFLPAEKREVRDYFSLGGEKLKEAVFGIIPELLFSGIAIGVILIYLLYKYLTQWGVR